MQAQLIYIGRNGRHHHPHPTTGEPRQHNNTRSPAESRIRARWAVQDAATLERATEARSRCGSWAPGAAVNYEDFRALADAEDLLRGPASNDNAITVRSRHPEGAAAMNLSDADQLGPIEYSHHIGRILDVR